MPKKTELPAQQEVTEQLREQPFEVGLNPDGQAVEESHTPVASAVAESRWTALVVALGAWCALFPVAGLLNTLGTFQTYVSQHQLRDYSEQQVGWIFSMYPFLLAFGGGQVGPIFDAYGLRWLLIPGYLSFVVALVAFSFCIEYYQFFLSFGILGGVASSCVWTTSLATTGHWFFHHRGIATGVVTSAGPLGGIAFPLLFEYLELKIGFGWTIRVMALICLVMGVLAIVLMRTRLPSSNHIEWNANFTILTDTRFVLTIFAMFFIDFACLIPAAYITPYAISQGMDSRMAYRLLAIMNAAQVPGRMIPGWLADQVGRFNVMVLSSLPCAMVILILWLFATNTGTIIAFSILFGLLSGTANSLTPVCISQLCRTEDYGSKYGTAYLFLSPATLIGIPVAGAVLDSDGKGSNFRGLILLCGFTYLASSVFFILARIAGAGLKVRKVF